jgi:hypothetical protein
MALIKVDEFLICSVFLSKVKNFIIRPLCQCQSL